jgi:hypothetical protein
MRLGLAATALAVLALLTTASSALGDSAPLGTCKTVA